MLSWFRERKKNRLVAARMRLVAPQALPDWLCEFAMLLDSGHRPERVSEQERCDVERAAAEEVAGLSELYPYRDTPWAWLLTLRYLTNRPYLENRPLDISDILAAAPALRSGVPCFERVIVRAAPRAASAGVRDAVALWLDGAEDAVRRTASISDRRLASCCHVGRAYRAHQTALHASRREAASDPASTVSASTVHAAAERHPCGGEPVDDDQAVAIVRRCALEGDAAAQFDLGMACLAGRNLARGHKEGVMWLERAAAAGYAPARFQLGHVYEEGKHVQRDPILAMAWFKLAAESGEEQAAARSRRLESELSGWQLAAADWLHGHLAGGAAERLYPPASPTRLDSWWQH